MGNLIQSIDKTCKSEICDSDLKLSYANFSSDINKSQVVRVEADLSGISAACAISRKFISRKCLTLTMEVKATEYDDCDGATATANINFCKSHMTHFFVIALTVSEILTFQMCDLENLGQGDGVQHSQWSHSMSTSLKVVLEHFSLAVTVLIYLYFKIRNVENIGQGHDLDLHFHAISLTDRPEAFDTVHSPVHTVHNIRSGWGKH